MLKHLETILVLFVTYQQGKKGILAFKNQEEKGLAQR